MKRTHLCSLAIGMAMLTPVFSVHAQENRNPRAHWFTDARFGMFIHWGVYSGAEGIWKGEKLRDDNNYAEWIYYRNQIGKEEYTQLLKRFDWEGIEPEEWVLLAKKAGMKYVTLTAKHHDGFALWDSQVSEYNIAEFSENRRDIVGELAAACRKHGLKLGLYYSHWIDWEHPDGWNHNKEIDGISPEAYDRYWQGKVMPQMRELLSNYGDIGLIWFDMWIHHSNTCVTRDQLLQLKDLIRDLQPDCLVNSRLGLSMEEDSDIDFKTLGDNQLGNKKEDFPWQSPATVAHSWGFHALEQQWKSTSTLLQNLIGNASLNGNMMLNIGPRANGKVPYEIEQRLLQMGNWLAVNGEALYGTQAFDLAKDQHDWGKITCKSLDNGTTRLYLHLYNYPLKKEIPLTGVLTRPQKAWLLADKSASPLAWTHREALTRISLPESPPDPYVNVVVLEYGQYPEVVDGLSAESVYSGFSLQPAAAIRQSGDGQLIQKSRRGSVPAHIRIERSSSFTWRIYVDRPMILYADASYNFQGKNKQGKIRLRSDAGSLEGQPHHTGPYVAEPNRNWQLGSFKAHRLGRLEFRQAGYYEISLDLEAPAGSPLDFQWLWLGEE